MNYGNIPNNIPFVIQFTSTATYPYTQEFVVMWIDECLYYIDESKLGERVRLNKDWYKPVAVDWFDESTTHNLTVNTKIINTECKCSFIGFGHDNNCVYVMNKDNIK